MINLKASYFQVMEPIFNNFAFLKILNDELPSDMKNIDIFGFESYIQFSLGF